MPIEPECNDPTRYVLTARQLRKEWSNFFNNNHDGKIPRLPGTSKYAETVKSLRFLINELLENEHPDIGGKCSCDYPETQNDDLIEATVDAGFKGCERCNAKESSKDFSTMIENTNALDKGVDELDNLKIEKDEFRRFLEHLKLYGANLSKQIKETVQDLDRLDKEVKTLGKRYRQET